MRSSGIKTYLANRESVAIDPAADAAYKRSLTELAPRITRKLRDSKAAAADFRLSGSRASRSKEKKD